MDTASPPAAAVAESPTAATAGRDSAAVQRRTLKLLFLSQTIGGVGIAIGFTVGALLAAELAGIGMSGLAQSAAVVGSALFAVPAARLAQERGRRPSLVAVYLLAAVGGAIVLAAAMRGSAALFFFGFLLFGSATTANLQARYAAIDLAPPAARGRHLSLIVWATTLGAVAGPNLAPWAGAALAPLGVPTLAGPFAFSAAIFLVQAAILTLWMRPDPLLVAQGRAERAAAQPTERSAGVRAALVDVAARPAARLGVGATAVGHLVMIAVMAMTPVHISGAGHDAAHTLRIVGVVLSLHVAGMFAFSPVTGWLTDRLGRQPVILGGIALLLAACAIAGTAGHDVVRLATGLWVLGLGWSCTMVAGSTLLAESVPAELRPSAQGLSDTAMGLAGAAGAAASGVVVHLWGYPVLTLLAALATVLVVPLLVRGRR